MSNIVIEHNYLSYDEAGTDLRLLKQRPLTEAASCDPPTYLSVGLHSAGSGSHARTDSVLDVATMT
jgi:hypothetical protein